MQLNEVVQSAFNRVLKKAQRFKDFWVTTDKETGKRAFLGGMITEHHAEPGSRIEPEFPPDGLWNPISRNSFFVKSLASMISFRIIRSSDQNQPKAPQTPRKTVECGYCTKGGKELSPAEEARVDNFIEGFKTAVKISDQQNGGPAP